MKLFHRHQWTTIYKLLLSTGTLSYKVPIKRECQKCGQKEINVDNHWRKVKTLRDLELYEVL